MVGGLFGGNAASATSGGLSSWSHLPSSLARNETFIAAVRRAIPSPRLGRPRDIANGVVFLASDEAEYINGVLLPIDGGLTCKLGIPDTSALSAIEPS